jgi:hypothetical protein
MVSLSDASELVVGAFLAALAGIVFMRMLDGTIRTRYLLHGRRADGTRYFSPERVQLLVITILVAFNYLLSVLDDRAARSLPDVAPSTLALLLGSHGLYLGGKAYSMLFTQVTK